MKTGHTAIPSEQTHSIAWHPTHLRHAWLAVVQAVQPRGQPHADVVVHQLSADVVGRHHMQVELRQRLLHHLVQPVRVEPHVRSVGERPLDAE